MEVMMDKLHIEIIKPDCKKCDMQADSILVPGFEGDLEILTGHTPLVTKLRPGTVIITEGDTAEYYAIHNGFITIDNNSVIIITETIEAKDEIDIKRAEEAKERAEKRLTGKLGDVDFRRAEGALKKAIARINTVS